MDEQNNSSEQSQDQAASGDTTKPQASGVEDVEKVKAVSALAYLLFFVPLLTNPESEFAKYHANQGLMLLLTGIVVMITGSFIPILGWFIILPFGSIFVLVLLIMGVINALNGKKQPLPLVGGVELIK